MRCKIEQDARSPIPPALAAGHAFLETASDKSLSGNGAGSAWSLPDRCGRSDETEAPEGSEEPSCRLHAFLDSVSDQPGVDRVGEYESPAHGDLHHEPESP